jgi:hypothetical protein
LPLWYLLIIPFGTFCLLLWYILMTLLNLLVVPLVHSGFPFGTFYLPLWCLLVFHLVPSSFPFGTYCRSLW